MTDRPEQQHIDLPLALAMLEEAEALVRTLRLRLGVTRRDLNAANAALSELARAKESDPEATQT